MKTLLTAAAACVFATAAFADDVRIDDVRDSVLNDSYILQAGLVNGAIVVQGAEFEEIVFENELFTIDEDAFRSGTYNVLGNLAVGEEFAVIADRGAEVENDYEGGFDPLP